MTQVWGHDGCGAYWAIKLTSCPRHPGKKLKEVTMPKITRYGGHSIAGITDTATGQTERGHGLVEDTGAIQAKAEGLLAVTESPGVELPFDPGTLSVADVNLLLEDASDDEREAVLQAEREGKNRKGILGE